VNTEVAPEMAVFEFRQALLETYWDLLAGWHAPLAVSRYGGREQFTFFTEQHRTAWGGEQGVHGPPFGPYQQ
jgi:hypothetical protein